MNGWERNGKRFLKGCLWAPVFLFGAIALGFEPSFKLLVLVVLCDFWGSLLEIFIPTADEATPSAQPKRS